MRYFPLLRPRAVRAPGAVGGLGGEFRTVALATLALEFALGIQRGVYPNFVAEVLGIAPDQLGAVESIREIPGLLTVVLGAAAVFFRQSTFTALTLLVTALGLGLYALTHTLWQLVVATVVVSIGFHLFYPLQSAMVLRIATPQERATRLGQVNSVTAAASLLAMGTVLFLTRGLGFCNYPAFFALAAGASCAGALVLLSRRGNGGGRLRRPLVFRRAYMSYYLLTFLAGSRRHMYMTFAAFALVKIYHTPLTVMMTLLAISNVVAILTRPLLGRLIDRWGEQRSLMLNYALVVPLFLAYGFLPYPRILYGVYILDSALFGFEIAISSHLGKIARPEELASTLAAGGTVNHIAGVLVPFLGGLLWAAWGPGATFLGGALLGLASLWYSAGLSAVQARAAGLAPSPPTTGEPLAGRPPAGSAGP
ncbi:MAG: MFS transporter [Bacillota bacterium]|nr:MFS transporter [Bacillota bacterium]MDI7250587.1 MFS transporter [Bacillota bacterium]